MTEPDTPDEPIRIDADDARGAEIILKKGRNRMIFVAGLVAFVVLAILFGSPQAPARPSGRLGFRPNGRPAFALAGC